jgi:hypothetical protein
VDDCTSGLIAIEFMVDGFRQAEGDRRTSGLFQLKPIRGAGVPVVRPQAGAGRTKIVNRRAFSGQKLLNRQPRRSF